MPRVPKPMTLRRLRNITAHYLQQHTTTRGHLRRLLLDRARKSLMHHDGDEAQMSQWVETVVNELVAQGLVSDRAWATSRIQRLTRRGLSERAMRSNLRAKFVDSALIDELLAEAAPDPLIAATRFAKRRRLGPFREHSREERRDKDLGKMARAGFSFDIVRQVLELGQEEALALIYPPLNDPSCS